MGPKSDRHYSTVFTDSLHLGQARVRIGEKSKPWDFLKALSIDEDREQRLKLTLEQSIELGELEFINDTKALNHNAEAFIKAIIQALLENRSKDITVYVHGATANFYTAVSQAAQI